MRADEALDRLGVEYETIEQDSPTVDCDEAARARGLETRQIVKSLIVEAGDERYHVCIPGDRELSEGKFREHRMVDPETCEDLTGQEPGTVHPFASDLPHLVDFRVFENETVSHTSGSKTAAVKLDAEQFREALERTEFELIESDLVVSEERDAEMLDLEDSDAAFIADSGHMDLYTRLEGDPEIRVKLVQELKRHGLDPDKEEVQEMVNLSESETHLQKLVEQYAETGELQDGEDFDLEEAVEEILEENPDAVSDLEEGKESAVNYLVGQVMQKTSGRADPGEATRLVRSRILDE